MNFGDLAGLGVAAPFIWYLIQKEAKDRAERILRARADLRLSLAIDRLYLHLMGKPLNLPEASDEQG